MRDTNFRAVYNVYVHIACTQKNVVLSFTIKDRRSVRNVLLTDKDVYRLLYV